MDPEFSLQDVVRCHLCEISVPLSHCVICNIHMCKACERDHLSDTTKEHIVVPFKYRRNIPKCQNHSTNFCNSYCEYCYFPICTLCVSSKGHNHHNVVEFSESIETKKRVLQKDLQDLEKSILPKYQEIVSNIIAQKAYLNENSQNLRTTINKYGEELHRDIDTVMKCLKSDLSEIGSKHLAVLNKQKK